MSRVNVLLPEPVWVVRSARIGRGSVLLRGTDEALQELADGLAFAANHESRADSRGRLDEAWARVEAAIQGF